MTRHRPKKKSELHQNLLPVRVSENSLIIL
uniref:Uncharacterized protein n=1 Tax=Rhizophora mucronata TaxID=61149 RepID=A0A2P2R3L9_RHIMU